MFLLQQDHTEREQICEALEKQWGPQGHSHSPFQVSPERHLCPLHAPPFTTLRLCTALEATLPLFVPTFFFTSQVGLRALNPYYCPPLVSWWRSLAGKPSSPSPKLAWAPSSCELDRHMQGCNSGEEKEGAASIDSELCWLECSESNAVLLLLLHGGFIIKKTLECLNLSNTIIAHYKVNIIGIHWSTSR